MKSDQQNNKNKFTPAASLDKISVLSFLVLFGGILLLSYPGLVSDSWAATPEDEECSVSGIFYDQDNPRVLINGELLSVNSYCCGGRITGISAEFIVVRFPYGTREYKLGDTFRKEKAKVKPSKIVPKVVSPYTSYANKVNSLVENFMLSHSQQVAALDMRMKDSLFVDPDEAAQIRVRAARMLELIQDKKQELSGFSLPEKCRRQHSLTIKLFDIAEDGWKAVSAGDKVKAEVFFERLLKVSQEISRESVSILAR